MAKNEYWVVEFEKNRVIKCEVERDGKVNWCREIDNQGNPDKFTAIHHPNIDIYTKKEKADQRLQYLNHLYHHTFDYEPFIEESLLARHVKRLSFIEKSIKEKLKDYPNFMGIDFCNVGAGGIQIRGHHKQVKNYTYGKQPTINYDFSNYPSCIDEFVTMWKFYDNPKRINYELRVIHDCDKYGWD